jgi:3-isopropylmalate/(R)-2-methylmalate dehydratase small subunit
MTAPAGTPQNKKEKDMSTVIRGTCWVFGDGISTDHITPGRYYHLRGDIPALAEHALEDADPGFAAEARPGEIVVGGANFGQGSSREHAALVLKERGIPVVLARSFARIFFRNMVNVGVTPITCSTEGFQTGDELKIDLEAGEVVNLTRDLTVPFQPLPPIMREILDAGGLVPYVQEHGGFA